MAVVFDTTKKYYRSQR